WRRRPWIVRGCRCRGRGPRGECLLRNRARPAPLIGGTWPQRAARFALRESRDLFRGRFALGRRIGGRRLAVRYRVERGNAAHSAELAFRVRHLALRALGRSTIPKVANEARVFLHRSEEHTSELQSRFDLVCRLLLEKKKKK